MDYLDRIAIEDHPQLRAIAWHLVGGTIIAAGDALALYERHWWLVDQTALDPEERRLIERLCDHFKVDLFMNACHPPDRLWRLLDCFNVEALVAANCMLSGDLALEWWLGDGRSIHEIELCCASVDGMAEVRNAASDDLCRLMKRPFELTRPVRFDAISVSIRLVFEGAHIGARIVHEARYQARSEPTSGSELPVMDAASLITRLLLAATDTPRNAEEARQRTIDLHALACKRGGIPRSAWRDARRANGRCVFDAHRRARAEEAAAERDER